MHLTSLTEIDLAIGIAGTDDMWNTSMSIQFDTMHDAAYSNGIDTGVQHNSLASSLVTLVVKAKEILYNKNTENELTFTIDYLTSMHFLDNAKYLQVQGLLGTDDAYNVDINGENMELQWSDAALENCLTSNSVLYSCAVRRSIVGGVTTDTVGAHDFALPDHSSDDAGCVTFITENLLGQNEFAIELATNMTALVRSKFEVDNYMRRAWYINPGFVWPTPANDFGQVILFSSK
jgi:hypothetical protein